MEQNNKSIRDNIKLFMVRNNIQKECKILLK